jgi:rhodanese-related sulfurtransferase
MNPETEQLLAAARQRAETAPMAYAGAVTPAEAFSLLQSAPRIRLIDVRTRAERDWIGKVAIDPAQQTGIEWNTYPGGAQNTGFLAELQATAAPDDILLFLCRSGVRSRHAATLAAANGFANCFDILEGFEGDRDTEGHRKNVNGWCKAGLPWIGA